MRAARLRRLPAEGFVPPHPAATDAAFAADVRAFAAAFWSLTPADRRARWKALAGCPVGAAAARLGDLEPGLGVVPVAQPDPRAAELSDLVRELFVLPPAARAARRVAWLTAADRRDAKWVAASRAVLRTDLPLARLDERLFDWFSLGDRPAAVPAVAESAARVRWPGRPVSEPVPVAAPAAAAGGLGCLTGPGAIIFALIVVVRIIIAVSGSSRSPSSTYPPPRPPVNAPAPNFGPPPQPWQPPAGR